ncbi:MAG TPA: DNA-protecting protein DprA [Candidatus Scybalomonas excrementigallinarum]|nr:DNA-protecting protein DprA [Candidatus Scybalomonas excrementigallinarum]
MAYSQNSMCAILLCSYVGIDKNSSLKPLSIGEWNTFLDGIIHIKAEPSIIFSTDNSWMEKMNYSNQQKERMIELISRGASVAFELEELEKKGVNIVSLFDSDYPILIRKKLKKKAPPILFYAGNLELAKKIGIAIVGSRNVDDEGIEFTKKLVQKAANEKLIIYSGGARGVDTISEMTALHSGSAVVSFLSDSLLSRIKKQEVIKYIIAGTLLLFSDVKPDVGFTAARAMNRNKYIYASAYGAFVIESDYNKGGTWNGAIESIKNDYTKTLIWNNKKYNGNLKLIENGGIPYEMTEESIYSIITKKEQNFEQLDLFSDCVYKNDTVKINKAKDDEKKNCKNDIYNMIKMFLVEYIGSGRSLEEISNNFDILDSQMYIWLEHLCKEKFVKFDKGAYKRI